MIAEVTLADTTFGRRPGGSRPGRLRLPQPSDSGRRLNGCSRSTGRRSNNTSCD